MSWLLAGLLCLVAFVSEQAMAGAGSSAAVKNTRQPSWTLPASGALGLTFVYYTACLVVAQRLIAQGVGASPAREAFVLLIVLLASNVIFAWLFFRRRDLRAGFLLSLPYAVLVAALILTLSRFDPFSAWAVAIYAVSLPYSVTWSYSVWKMNS